MTLLFPLFSLFQTPVAHGAELTEHTLSSATYEDRRLVRQVLDHHWTETVIETEYTDDGSVAVVRDIARHARDWSVRTGVGTPIVTTMDFAERVGDRDTLDRLDRQTRSTRVLAVGGIAGGLATAAVGYLALSGGDRAPTGVGVMVPSLGLGIAGVSLLPHLLVQQKRGSIHAAYTEPEVDAWIARHNDVVAAEIGDVAARRAWPDVEQVATFSP